MKNLKHLGFGPEAMKEIKVCAACGAKADAAQRFCRECGAGLPAETLYDTYGCSRQGGEANQRRQTD